MLSELDEMVLDDIILEGLVLDVDILFRLKEIYIKILKDLIIIKSDHVIKNGGEEYIDFMGTKICIKSEDIKKHMDITNPYNKKLTAVAVFKERKILINIVLPEEIENEIIVTNNQQDMDIFPVNNDFSINVKPFPALLNDS